MAVLLNWEEVVAMKGDGLKIARLHRKVMAAFHCNVVQWMMDLIEDGLRRFVTVVHN